MTPSQFLEMLWLVFESIIIPAFFVGVIVLGSLWLYGALMDEKDGE